MGVIIQIFHLLLFNDISKGPPTWGRPLKLNLPVGGKLQLTFGVVSMQELVRFESQRSLQKFFVKGGDRFVLM